MSRRLLICALLGFAATSCAAQAADVDPQALGWSGPRAGIYGGYGTLEGDGPLAGVTLGYDWRFENVVIGLDGGISAGGLDARQAGGRYDVDAMGEIRARIGYAFDRFMAYGAVGAAFAATDYVRAGRRDQALQSGWLVGAGVEVRLLDQLSATAEYIYVDLDRKTFRAAGDVGIDASGGQVRLGLNYRF